MSICINTAGSSLVVEPSYTASTCPYYLLVTRDEWNLSRLMPEMTPAEAVQIATPILALWAIAWGFRQLVEFIKSRHMAQSQE